MKKLLLMVLVLGMNESSFAQNTFPASGNVGIGTINPGNLLQINSGSAPNTAQFKITANGTGGVSILTYAPDNSAINFDSEWASGWIARSTSAASIYKAVGQLRIYGDAGLTPGQGIPLSPRMVVDLLSGNVGIGTTTPSEKLAVNGKIRAKEIKVEATPWPDYVFDDGYELEKLEGLEKFIKVNKHLPEIPSAAEVEKNGINLGEMNAKLLQKIEELTLHLIEMDKKVTAIKDENTHLKSEISQLKSKH